MTGASCRATLAVVSILLLASGCGDGPTNPSEQAIIVRLIVSPPTIQARPNSSGWTAAWTVNVDAATAFPSDTHGVLLTVAPGPATLETVDSRVTDAAGVLVASAVTGAAEILAGNGSVRVAAGGMLIQVAQQVSHSPGAAPPFDLNLTIVARLRNARGDPAQLATVSAIHALADAAPRAFGDLAGMFAPPGRRVGRTSPWSATASS